MRAMLFGMLCCAAIVMSGCQEATNTITPDELSVQTLEIVDTNGNRRAKLSYFEASESASGRAGVSLIMYDEKGKKRLTLAVPDGEKGGPAMLLLRPNEKPHIGVASWKGVPEIFVSNTKGKGFEPMWTEVD